MVEHGLTLTTGRLCIGLRLYDGLGVFLKVIAARDLIADFRGGIGIEAGLEGARRICAVVGIVIAGHTAIALVGCILIFGVLIDLYVEGNREYLIRLEKIIILKIKLYLTVLKRAGFDNARTGSGGGAVLPEDGGDAVFGHRDLKGGVIGVVVYVFA